MVENRYSTGRLRLVAEWHHIANIPGYTDMDADMKGVAEAERYADRKATSLLCLL
jgi:hypothetical protein